jgi:hypothetical protein
VIETARRLRYSRMPLAVVGVHMNNAKPKMPILNFVKVSATALT